MNTVVLACDHAAFSRKEKIRKWLEEKNFQVVDVGTYSEERCDYPKFAIDGVKKVLSQEGAKGIFICGSGIGVSMVANRFSGIRAALCGSVEEAVLSRQHNDANILCMGSRLRDEELMKQMIEKWLDCDFEFGRHSDRIKLFNSIGER